MTVSGGAGPNNSSETAGAVVEIREALRFEHAGLPTTWHELRCWTDSFDAVSRGDKTAELRRDDRAPAFGPGDTLWLREWNKHTGYTGAVVFRRVTHVLRDAEQFGLAPGFAMLSMEDL